eukprot:scaffold11041_cov117-Cylindrotheca_fusiformis.AAC.3
MESVGSNDDRGRDTSTSPKAVVLMSRIVTVTGIILFCLFSLRQQSGEVYEHIEESVETSLKVKVEDLPAPSSFSEKNDSSTTFLYPTQTPSSLPTQAPLLPTQAPSLPTQTASSIHQRRIICPLSNQRTLNVTVFPHFIIIGAQKAGTSAISALLETSQSILRSVEFEAHFWNTGTRKRAYSKTNWTAEEKCDIILQYRRFFEMKHAKQDTIIFEKTPRLLALPQVPRLIREVLHPHVPKLLVALRDPVDRFYSAFKMHHEALLKGKNKSASEIVEYVEQEVAQDIEEAYITMLNVGLIDELPAEVQNWNQTTIALNASNTNSSLTCNEKCRLDTYEQRVARGIYVHQIEKYMDYFEIGTELKVVQYENFTRNRRDGLNEILRFVGAPLHNLTEEELQADLSPTSKMVGANGIIIEDNSTEPERVKFPPLPQHLRDILNTLYKPYNAQLEGLLGEEWRNVWSS